MNDNRFTRVGGAYYWARTPAGYGIRTSISTTTNPITITPKGNGDYEAAIWGLGPNFRTFDAGTTFLLNVNSGNSNEAASIVTHKGGPDRFVVTNDSCFACHGDAVFRAPEGPESAEHHGANPRGVEACVVCHNRDNYGPGLGAGATTDGGYGFGTRLMGYVHGIHNSHNMPGGPVQIYSNGWKTVTAPAGTYVRSVLSDGGIGDTFAVGYPSYTNNCSTCHNTPAALARVNSAPVSFQLCMSCHQNWDGFANTRVGGTAASIHRTATAATNCTNGCHVAGAPLAATKISPSDFHNGLKTERAGLIWDGDDVSVELGKTVRMAITGVSVVSNPADGGFNTVITWTADQRGADGGFAAVDPCNFNWAAGPIFFGLGSGNADAGAGIAASNLSILRAYAQGNDWVNNGLAGSTSPGQPAGAINVASPSNTSCAANVATTTVPNENVTASLAIVSIQGKPQIQFPAGAGKPGANYIQIRSESPTYEYNPATGAAATVKRRNIADIKKCNSCHEGSMYQHGGNRIDSIDLCEMCHNPAANEGNNRLSMGVDPSEAYDGKIGESYDLRYMVHAIHSAGETQQPLAYYRSNGIYFFGTSAALAKVTTWPGSGCQAVAGSSAKLGADCDAAGGAGARKAHNFIEIHYPRSLADCNACHIAGSVETLPDQRQAVALTVDPGAAPYNNTDNDTVIGPTAASCMSCHQSGDSYTQYTLRQHAYGFGFQPTAAPRADILNVPTNAQYVERCAGCHQGVASKHAVRNVRTVSEISAIP